MATLIHLDTHLLVWLYLARSDLITTPAREAVEHGRLSFSPMAELEITYLCEIGRLKVDGKVVVASLHDQIGLVADPTPFAAVITTAHAQAWTRDPFDRVIAAQALVAGASLVTADDTIRDNVPNTIW